jgi:hypothetical protein
MGKRSNFERRSRDFYPTPLNAALPLIPYLDGIHRFAEPCSGDGRLIRHLESPDRICVYHGDIATGQDALARTEYGAPDEIITNPPYTCPLLHQLISHFIGIAPTWLLLPMDFASNKRDAPFLAACTDIVPIGRVKWVEGTKFSSNENFGWFHFQKGHCDGPRIHPRKVVNGGVTQPQQATIKPIADNLVWIDFETASKLDLPASGAFRYASDDSTRAIVLAYAIGDGMVRIWHADGAILDWDNAPDDLRAAFDRGATFAAWNASFDSAVWNYATLGFPLLAPERVIDPMVQAGVSNLPTDLEKASRALGGGGKQADGKKLIKLFCVEGADPRQHPEEWQRFLAYARRDVEKMRDAYRKTRPLPIEEWRQYWAFEQINRRGVTLDLPFVFRAEALAAEDGIASGRRLTELTGGTVTRVTQAKRIATWLHDQLPDAAAGRIAFVYRDDHLGGALFMALPSGRVLTYPRPRWRDVDVLDKDGKPTGEKRTELSFRRAHGRTKLWHGTLCENAVQAAAADILRKTVTRIETNPALSFMPIRMTTHDEILCEVDEARAAEAKAILRREMLTLPEWATGLPLQSEESTCHYYSKAKAALRGGRP